MGSYWNWSLVMVVGPGLHQILSGFQVRGARRLRVFLRRFTWKSQEGSGKWLLSGLRPPPLKGSLTELSCPRFPPVKGRALLRAGVRLWVPPRGRDCSRHK